MKVFKYLFFSVILFLVSCNTSRNLVSDSKVIDDGKISFTFLQVNDVYEIAPLAGGKVGGMARLATLKKQLLEENQNTFLFMAGDFLSPSLVGSIKYQGNRVKGKQMIEAMNTVGFDLVTFGNHEFDLSKNELQERLNESNFNWTSANARQKVSGNTYPFYKERKGIKEFVSDIHIIELKDADGTTIKIGFFSVMLPSNPQNYVAYTDMFEQAKRAYTRAKQKSDLVFGLTHVNIEDDKKIASLLPDLPLIMGGHEHTNMLVEVGNTKISKADANAKTAYIHRIEYDKNSRTYKLSSELKSISQQLANDPKTQNVVDKWSFILNKQIKEIVSLPEEIIYNAVTPLEGRDTPVRIQQTNLGHIITRAMAFGFNDEVDCALVNGGSIRIDDQLEGEINSIDIFRVLPFGGGVLKVELTGKLLKEVLDYGMSKAGEGAYLQRYLVNFDTVLNDWKINNKLIDLDKVYTVAFSDYLLKGYDIPFLKPDNKDVLNIYKPASNELGSDIRKTIIAYLKSLK